MTDATTVSEDSPGAALPAPAPRCADHRAGARSGAVSGHGAADHPRPAPLRPGGAESGAGTKTGRHCHAAQRRARRPAPDRHASDGDHRQYRPLHHRAGRHQPSHLPGRAEVPCARLPDRLAILRRQDGKDSGARSEFGPDRGPFRPSQRPGDRGDPAPAASAERIAGDHPRGRFAGRARRFGGDLHGR